MHKKAWETLVRQAKGDPYARYALYASRTLAVRHPEAYLVGDNWFYEGARSIKGFKESYDEPTALGGCHMEYGREFFQKGEGYEGIEDGHSLSFAALQLDKYRLTEARRIYPEPFFPFLDQRLGPLPLTLKTEGRVVTGLELAEIAYFQAKEAGTDLQQLFLVYCDNEEAYLLQEEKLISIRTGNPVLSIEGSPVLIFNESAVWYPLMERDDRGASAPLAEAVKRLATGESAPAGEQWEHSLIASLKAVTSLDSLDQLHMAALASVRAGGWRFHPYAEAWKSFVPEEDLDIDISRRLGLIREFDRLANSISPATAYLSEIAGGEGSLEERMRRFSHEYLINTAVVREAEAHGWKNAWRLESWGHLWPCGLMEHTIDDAFRSRTGHCVSQAHMIAAVLEMSEIPHAVVNFDRGGVVEDQNHHIVLSLDGSFLFDDGIVNFLGIDMETLDQGPLLSFSINGVWASTVGDKLYGNISSLRVHQLIEKVETALSGRFALRFYADEAERRIISRTEFCEMLKTLAVEQVILP
jgi:hypothetical protein